MKTLAKTAFLVSLGAATLLACGGNSGQSSSNNATGGNGGSGGTGGNVSTGGSGGEGGNPFLDSDGDGILDTAEGKDAPGGPTDTDGDGTPDYLDTDSDDDGVGDIAEGMGDIDGDGIPDTKDPINDAPPTPITLTAISTPFNSPIGIDFHEPTQSVVISANYPTGSPLNFERIQADGTHTPFSDVFGLTDEVKIATARSGNVGGFITGELFVGNGLDGELVRISPDGKTVVNPWVSVPGDANGLFRGSLYVDPTGLYGGDLIAVTTAGEVWRIKSTGEPTKLAAVGVHLEGLLIVPNFPARFGPIAGKIIVGAEEQQLLYAFDSSGAYETYSLGVAIEDIDRVMPNENFFGVNFGTSRLLGASADDFKTMVGDIILAQETVVSTGLFRLFWNGSALVAQEIPLSPTSATPGQWEHVTFAGAGISEIPVPK